MAQINYQIQELLNRVVALEAATTPQTEDFSDPPLFLTNNDGSPVSPDSIEDIPDLVKGLPSFSGDPNELSFFIEDAEAIVRLYSPNSRSTIDDRNKFHVVCKSIRRKIKGEANDALVASNVYINWNMIKKTLVTYYGEKRDLETLDYQLMSSVQRGKSLEEYYDSVNKILSLIANSIRTDKRFAHPEATKAMIYTYNKKAIDAFIRGLDGDVGRFLKNYEPESLAHAYSYCITFQNIEFRKNITGTKIPEVPNKPRNLIPMLPPRPAPRLCMPPPLHKNSPQLITHQNFRQQYYEKPFVPPRNPAVVSRFDPRFQRNLPQPRNPFQQQNRPEPMDIDASINTRQVNYSNRPINSNQHPAKRQRLFNISRDDPVEHGVEEEYAEECGDVSNEMSDDSSFQRYVKELHSDGESTFEDNAEFNFLG